MSQHRKPTRTELENRIRDMNAVMDKDIERMRAASSIIEEQKAEIERLKAVIAADTKRHEVPQPPPQLFWCSVPTCPGLSYSASERAHPCRR